VCAEWLERLGFRTRIVERLFDSMFRCRTDEPRLALCGFDSNQARRNLATAEFLSVVESGLGGMAHNFDAISAHTLPNPRSTAELWPDLNNEEEQKRRHEQERIARENAAYSRIGRDECGRYELASKAVAVPFVGATAASFVVAEAIRMLHDGAAYTDIKLRLSAPGRRSARTTRNYGVADYGWMKYCEAKVLGAG
jgi:hypothetical protein